LPYVVIAHRQGISKGEAPERDAGSQDLGATHLPAIPHITERRTSKRYHQENKGGEKRGTQAGNCIRAEIHEGAIWIVLTGNKEWEL